MKSVWSDETGRIINKFNKISCCVPLTSLYLKKKLIKKKNVKKILNIKKKKRSYSSNLVCFLLVNAVQGVH